MQKITPFLWYATEAEEAASFYASIFPDSRVKRVVSMPSESPSGPPGSVKVVDFELFGQPFVAMTAGKLDPFNHAVSFVVNCDNQAELDRYWNALLKDGEAQHIERKIHVTSALDAEQQAKLLEIADKTPVTKALAPGIPIQTTLDAGV